MALAALVLALALICPRRAEAAFGLATSTGYYTVDTGAGLVFKVNRSNGDITSLKFNGKDYQDQSRFSQINSGLGSSTVTGALWGSQTVRIEVTAGTLTHYYLARKGFNNIYMGTYFTAEPTIGLVRYIVRMPSSLVPNGPTVSDIRNNTGAVEASDVFGFANGQTHSKHYSNHRLMDFTAVGATGPNVGVYIVRSNHEGGSGGPFYRTIENQCGDDQEIYEIVNYGEGQTESFRYGVFNGPYTLAFTTGAAPVPPLDTSWIHSTGLDATLKGWVQNRGTVTGSASGIPAGFQGVVGFANTTAQYWCTVAGGKYTSPYIIPGTYVETLYKGELAVATQNVTVTTGAPLVKNIASTEVVPYQRWRIGEWDGTPSGFLNADKVTTMHPSDVRMSAWGPVTYTIGQSNAAQFPAYQWKDVNNATAIKFNLTAAQLTTHTLRVGLTCAFSGARPQIAVNSWKSSAPAASTQPSSRTLTVGTYRGNNVTYTYSIPASAFVAGTNTMYLTVVSGSGSTKFLSAGYSYDCVELDAPLPITPVPVASSITPAAATSLHGVPQTFSATYLDSDGADKIAGVRLLVNTGASEADSICVAYNQAQNKLYLLSDDGQTLLGGIAPGSAGSIDNRKATLQPALTTVTKTATTITVNWVITPKLPADGAQNLYGWANDNAGNSKPYAQLGTWAINNANPAVTGVSPSSVTTAADVFRVFASTFTDANGADDLGGVRLLANLSPSETQGICVTYNQTQNKLYLIADDGKTFLGGIAPGTTGSISNSRVTLNTGATTIARNGNTLTVQWAVTAKAAAIGVQNLYGYAFDKAGATNGYLTLGTWNIVDANMARKENTAPSWGGA